MPRVALVTDSTATLPADLVAAHDITVVPLQVVFGTQSYNEGTEATPERVARALRAKVPVSTSRAGPPVFLRVYEASARAGADAVVSVHLSGYMSGTYDSAVLAAAQAPIPVEAVDSKHLGMATGYAVLAAAGALAKGKGASEAADAARARAAATSAMFYVDTLEYLRRGGRIGAARALVGSALAVKPLLTVDDGRIVPLEKVRTSSRAVSRLEDLAVEAAGDQSVDLAVHHLANPDCAETLADRLLQRVSGVHDLVVCEVGAVIGAHVGPGMLGIVVAPRAED
jgi:DegV family protein with EDD domain